MELLEREDNLQVLEAAWQDVRAGQGRMALVSGEAGIGKTALVEAFTRGRDKPTRVLWGGCDSLFTPRPLGPLHDIAGQVGGDLAALLVADADRTSIFSAVLRELQSGPTVVVVEDVHWADEATLDLLKFLGRRIGRTSALLLLTYRDDELGPAHPLRTVLGDISTSPATRRVLLAPLSEQAIRQLIGGRPIDPIALHASMGGNPFFISEVLSNPEDDLPVNIREAVLARVARRSASARALLQAAAVIGPRIEAGILTEVAGAEAGAVEEALAAGLLNRQEDSLAFRHELARQIVLETIPPTHARALHRMTLDALRNSPATRGDLARLVHHAEAAGDREAVLEFAPAAAERAVAARSHRAAAALYELALRFADDLPAGEHAALLDEYGIECDLTNRRPEAIEARRKAAGLWLEASNPVKRGGSLSDMAVNLQMVGRLAEAEQANREALEILEVCPPCVERVLAYNMQAWLCLARGELREGIAVAEQAIDLAQEIRVPEKLSRLYEILGLCWIYLDHNRGCEYLERSLAVAVEFNHSARAANIYCNLGSIYVDFCALRRAEELFAHALPFAAENDLDFATSLLGGWRSLAALYLGRWADAASLASEILNGPATSPGRGIALAALGRLRTRRGDPQAAEALDESLDLLLKQGFRQREGMIRAARAEAAWSSGDNRLAIEEARAAYDQAIKDHQEWYVGELAFWRWKAGDELPALPEWTAAPYALHIAGDWRGSAAAWDVLGCPYERARALADGDPAAQVEALAIFDRLEARPHADRLREKMRAAGIATVPRGQRAATRENPFGLTNRQLEILLLLVEGLGNAEIASRLHLSAKTVDHHVSAVLGALGVHSREAAAELARQHPVAGGSSSAAALRALHGPRRRLPPRRD